MLGGFGALKPGAPKDAPRAEGPLQAGTTTEATRGQAAERERLRRRPSGDRPELDDRVSNKMPRNVDYNASCKEVQQNQYDDNLSGKPMKAYEFNRKQSVNILLEAESDGRHGMNPQAARSKKR